MVAGTEQRVVEIEADTEQRVVEIGALVADTGARVVGLFAGPPEEREPGTAGSEPAADSTAFYAYFATQTRDLTSHSRRTQVGTQFQEFWCQLNQLGVQLADGAIGANAYFPHRRSIGNGVGHGSNFQGQLFVTRCKVPIPDQINLAQIGVTACSQQPRFANSALSQQLLVVCGFDPVGVIGQHGRHKHFDFLLVSGIVWMQLDRGRMIELLYDPPSLMGGRLAKHLQLQVQLVQFIIKRQLHPRVSLIST